MKFNKEVSVIDTVKDRYSTVLFSDRSIEGEKIHQLFEAARWAPSSYNAQPWKFIVGVKGHESYKLILDSLVTNNKEWAQNAPLLVLSLAESVSSFNQKINKYAFYDLGMAVGNLLNQTTALGLYAHQMGGFNAEKVVESFHIPADYAVGAVIAIGYKGESYDFSDELQKRESTKRERKSINHVVQFNPFEQ